MFPENFLIIKQYLTLADNNNVTNGLISLMVAAVVELPIYGDQLDKTRVFFEKMLEYAIHLSLYFEQLAFSGEQLDSTCTIRTYRCRDYWTKEFDV